MSPKHSAPQPSAIHVIELEVTIRAPLARVWNALVSETGAWWPASFHTDPATRRFVIEPKLGGKMYEDWGNGEGLIWSTVTGIRAPTFLDATGVSSPQWGGPNTHYQSWRLAEQDGATVLRFSDAVHGKIDSQTATSLREGWLLLWNEALRTHCETPPARRPRR